MYQDNVFRGAKKDVIPLDFMSEQQAKVLANVWVARDTRQKRLLSIGLLLQTLQPAACFYK